jgi:amino acid transporter
VLAAIPAGLTALNFAELVAMLPRVGAEYTFLREAFPRLGWLPFAAGFLVVLTNATVAATVSLAFAGYLEQLVEAPRWLSALGLLAACTLVNVAGIRQSAWVAALFALIELGGLALVVGAGLESGRFAHGLIAPPHAGVFSAAALIFFVYTGFEGIVNLAEEAKARHLPRALPERHRHAVVLPWRWRWCSRRPRPASQRSPLATALLASCGSPPRSW